MAQYAPESVVQGSGIVACFKMKIEHEKIRRNNEKNNALEPLPDQ
jgi:hypothetical protein